MMRSTRDRSRGSWAAGPNNANQTSVLSRDRALSIDAGLQELQAFRCGRTASVSLVLWSPSTA